MLLNETWFSMLKNNYKHCIANWPYNWARQTWMDLSTEHTNFNKMFVTNCQNTIASQPLLNLVYLDKCSLLLENVSYLPADVSEAYLLPVVWFLIFLAPAGVHIPPWLDAQNPEAPADFVHALLEAPSLLFEA